ncbi:hypothetical protein RND71_026489 [Anisodus tanguticus]|uniref:Uncharacterized protein n=1 Tax=Anisodus tanguticus TaxID=243964 RepID=A0AAE1VBB9_9SOLA|nr:hypothetical protein RND71_026489 [Anisodus tanguticus]
MKPADCIVVVEELWWKAFDWQLLKDGLGHSSMWTNHKSLYRDELEHVEELPRSIHASGMDTIYTYYDTWFGSENCQSFFNWRE